MGEPTTMMAGTLNREASMYAYRCEQCRTTSPDVATQAQLHAERDKHRRLFHGGHIPDGEQLIEPERFRFMDLPPIQKVATVLLVLVILLAGWARFT